MTCIERDLSRFWAHILMAYVSTVWTCYVLQKEYAKVADLRLQFLASAERRPDQFTVREIEISTYSVLKIY